MSSTIRSRAERVAAVEKVVRAGRQVFLQREAIRKELVSTTGLSPEGVDLALSEHLEMDPPREEIERLVQATVEADHVHVILSANVFTAPLRALAMAYATAPSVTVSPSRREPVFIRALLESLSDPCVRIVHERAVPEGAQGEIHVYGRDETIEDVRATLPASATVRAHGTGMGVAFVPLMDDLQKAAERLACDVVPFDQRGCLSPRVAFVEGNDVRAQTFARELHSRLKELAIRIPRGRIFENERADVIRYADTMAYAGEILKSPDHAVGFLPSGLTIVIPPVARHVHVVSARDVRVVRELLKPVAPWVTAVGSSVESADRDELRCALNLPHVRVSPLGRMQKPPFDGPVDQRSTAILG